jgi:hypothetical protein
MKILIALTAALFAGSAVADEGDDTLRHFLSKSDIVLVGKIATEPEVHASDGGSAKYLFGFAVTESLKGEIADNYLNATIVHPESSADDKLTWLKKKSKALLFLRNAGDREHPNWIGADVWLSVQPYNQRMACSLKRLAAETPSERLPLMQGIVLSEKNGLVELSLGSNDGIKPGHVLFWYRENVKMGHFTVASATDEKATAKYVTSPEAGASLPKPNDRFVTLAK